MPRCGGSGLTLIRELEELLDADVPQRSDFEIDSPFEAAPSAQSLEEEVKRNSRTYVRWVQQSLNNIIGAKLTIDGISGPKTRAAVRRFQQRARIRIDGIMGSQLFDPTVAPSICRRVRGTGVRLLQTLAAAGGLITSLATRRQNVFRRGTRQVV